MKLAKRFAAMLMGATLAVGSALGLAGCDLGGNGGSAGTDNTQNGGSQSSEMEAQIRAVYDLYKANCAENNVTPQTYEQWLDFIKGAKGDKGDPGANGITPTIGDDDMWWIGDQPTEFKAVGKDGVTPSISSDGYWVFGETKTQYKAVAENGKSAYDLYVEHYDGEGDALEEDEWLASLKGDKGDKGDPGEDGTNGNAWLFGERDPASSKGVVGDFYLNTSSWDVLVKEEAGWKWVGCLKPAEPLPEKYATEVNLKATGTAELSIEGLQPGIHYVTAAVDLTTNQAKSASDHPEAWRIKPNNVNYWSIFGSPKSTENLSTSQSGKLYIGFIVVKEGAKSVTISANGLPLKARIIIEEELWTMSEMAAPEKAGKSSTQVIVPVNGFGMPQEDVAMFTCPDWMTERTYACSVMFSTLISSSDTTYTVTLKGEEHQELLTSTLQDKKTSAKFALAGKKAYLMHGSNTHSTIQSAIWPGLVQFTWVS